MIARLMNRVRQQLPISETWSEDTAQLLRVCLLLSAFVSVIALAASFLFRAAGWQRLVTDSLLVLVLSAVLWLLLRRGYVQLAVVGTVLVFATFAIFTASKGAGVRSLSYSLYILVVILTALLLHRRAAFWVASIGSLAGFGMIWAHQAGWMPNADSLPSELVVWLTMSAFFFVAAAMLNTAINQVESALQQAQRSLAERLRVEEEMRHLNAELEVRVAERTAELETSQERYRNFIELSAEGIWLLAFDAPIALDLPPEEQVHLIQQRGYIAECNEALAKMYGYTTPQQMIGQRLMDLYGGQPSEVNFQSTLQLARLGFRSANRLTEEVNEQGERVYFLNNAVGVIDGEYLVGIWGTQRDITELKRAEQALRLNDLRYRALFERTNDAVFIIGLKGEHITANRQAAALLGYSVDEIIKLNVSDVIAPREYTESQVRLRALMAGETIPVYERYFICKDGSEVPVEIDAALVRDDDGQPMHIQSIVRNIQERKQAEAEIRRLNQTLEQRVAQRTAELEITLKEMEGLSYHISHSLRSPLRAINGFAKILEQEYQHQMDASAREHLVKIDANTQLMGQMIDELLLYLRLGRMTISKHTVEPNFVVRQVVEKLRPIYAGQQVAFVVGELPPCQADEALVEEIFTQLVSNAVKFSRHRSQPVIEIGYGSGAQGEAYFVRDNGLGFDMRFASKLFGVFQRLVLPEEFDGTGIGLAITQRIVQRHGGRIWVEAEVDKGATFYFTLG